MNSAFRVVIATLSLAAPGCSAAPKKLEAKPVQEWKGQFGGPAEAGHRVIQTPEEWTKLWAEIGKPAPTVDLAHAVAVAVFMGPRNTGGYTAVWRTPEDDGKRVVLRYKVAPPKGMAMQALTQPWSVRLFDKPAKPVVVELEAE